MLGSAEVRREGISDKKYMHYLYPKFGQRDQKRKFVFAENKTLLMMRSLPSD
jgi:hypothetical protein